ncbi:FIST C-terminal domain-containing protein [Leadbettera azotonutricia]|uniref:FIST C-domain domain-containing protein n=1 Tax=Leadbettera azotonutricia (strain ATCC BAA-888 / DSM 13862 / ZAS-9) TaxID=545695 RepID=F5YFS5_LEAAZ|nr:FIST C-terminal domain-containing protein [Leadbettera azotonutricia]AEF80987.1 hypothetical protein TREAZ_2443 [Leadbettera azotonutricia ZAS-9]
MIKMLTAYCTEIDDVDGAITDILSQIDTTKLLANSVGLLSCHYEFIDSGVVAALQERLPFDILGYTTMASAARGQYSVYSLAFTVLTSDDVSFSTAVSRPLSEFDYKNPIRDAYGEALSKLKMKPAFIISYLPFVSTLSGAVTLECFDKVAKGIPIWGTVACNYTGAPEKCQILYKGKGEQHALAMLLLSGHIKPNFFTASLPARSVRTYKALITESEGCILKKVNGIRLRDYFAASGFSEGAEIGTIPLMVDYGDGNAVALAIYRFNEDGSAIMGGKVPEGASVSIGLINREGIMETTQKTLEQILSGVSSQGLLMCPCEGRYQLMAGDDEIKLIIEKMGDKLPYALGYSGGELCPSLDREGIYHNRLHNYSLIICSF